MRLRVLSVCAFVLASCANDTLTRDADLPAGSGVAILRVAGNMTFPEWRWVTLRREADGKEFALGSIPCSTRGSVVLAEALPPGRYLPVKMHASFTSGIPQTGQVTFTVDAPIEKQSTTFSVAAGRVTDLGTLVYNPLGAVDATHNRFEIAIDPSPLPVESLLRGAFPRVADALRGGQELGWDSLPPKEQRARLIAAAKSSARGRNALVASTAGVAYAGARLGEVVVLPKPGGSWLHFDTGTLEEITALLPLQDGGFLAGGELGFVSYSPDRGRSWQKLSFVEPNHAVTFLGIAATRDLVAIAESSEELIVYTSAKPATGWHELRRFPFHQPNILYNPGYFETKFSTAGEFHRESAAIGGTRLAILEQPKTVWSYDFATRQWEQSQPAPRALFTLRASRDGYLWATPFGANSMYGSADWGRSWTTLDYFAADIPPAFANRSTGFMAAKPVNGLAGLKLFKTTDGGTTWTEVGKLEDENLGRLAVDPSGKQLFAIANYDHVRVSSDGGNSWSAPH
jgi:hypothetical protein